MIKKSIFFACVSTLLIGCGDSVSLTDEEWSCQDKQCNVSFVLTNSGQNSINAHYAVRAQSAVQTITSDLSSGLVVAEIKETLSLDPGASKTIQHQFEAKRPPTNVKFSAWTK